MRVRVVTYAPDPLTDDIAGRIAGHFSLGRVDLSCGAYARWCGRLVAWRDRHRHILPEIETDAPIGAVDALIVGAPLEHGRLAAPMRRFLEKPGRIPPVIGVFATCDRRWPAPGLDEDVAALDNGLGGPDHVILCAPDMRPGDGDPPRLAAFLDRLAPLIRLPLTPVVLPGRVA